MRGEGLKRGPLGWERLLTTSTRGAARLHSQRTHRFPWTRKHDLDIHLAYVYMGGCKTTQSICDERNRIFRRKKRRWRTRRGEGHHFCVKRKTKRSRQKQNEMRRRKGRGNKARMRAAFRRCRTPKVNGEYSAQVNGGCAGR